jgi:hypothetical protein
VLIIADPRSTLLPEQVAAINAYVFGKKPGAPQGKLIVMSGPYPNIDGKGVAPTGLEQILIEMGVSLSRGHLVTVPFQGLKSNEFIATADRNALEGGNSVAGSVGDTPVLMRDARSLELAPRNEQGETQFQAEALLRSYPGTRYTWIDPDPPTDPDRQLQSFQANKDLLVKYQFSNRSRVLGATVTEGKTPRAVIFGSGAAFADAGRGESDIPPRIDIIAASIDWLRDRPKLAVVNKTYQAYSLPRTASTVRLLWLPAGMVLMMILVAGLGVWAVRRR